MSKQSLVVVDGDIISFKAAAACETRSIDVFRNDSHIGSWSNRTEFKESLKERGILDEYDSYRIEDKQEAEDIANCLHTVKVMLAGIKDATGCTELKVVVQGKGNFRDDLLLPSKYKGQRSEIKPLLLGECKNYLINRYKAELAHGQESDDVLASYAYQGYINKQYVVQASTDKDAFSNVGYLYNWDKMDKPVLIQGLGHLERNSKGKVSGLGRKWFYHQSLYGDKVDSLCPYQLSGARFGEKSSYDLLVELQTDQECWQAIYDKYIEWYPEPFEYEAWNGQKVQGSALQQMQVYVDGVHMRRFENDRLNVEEILTKMGVNFG